MEILVLIKQVPDDSVEVTVNPSTGAPDLAEITPVVNAFDTYALEMAARFKEANGGTVTVASIGGDEVDTGLRNCLSVGADKAYLIKDDSFKDADSTAKAYILSQAIPKIEEANGAKFDMIFTGLEATDYAGGLTGPQMAEDLGLGCVTSVIAVDPADNGVTIKQETESGYNVVEAATPVVLTVTKPDYDPRYPTMKTKRAARKMTIARVEGLELDAAKTAPATKVVKQYAPPKRQAGVTLTGDDINEITMKAIGMMADAKAI